MFILKLIRALKKAKIKYAIAGGHAVSLHGAVRGTMDVDIVVEHKEKFFLKLEEIFHKLGLESKLPVSAKEVFNFREEYKKNRNLLAWSFVNPNYPIEIVDVLLTDDLSKLKTIEFKIQGEELTVVSKADLIKMKKRSGRPQDIEDVKALEEIKE
ncbi:MAG: nucleotidyltransferase [bacterium]|nr:nucleotidyltransferase [bacterium]